MPRVVAVAVDRCRRTSLRVEIVNGVHEGQRRPVRKPGHVAFDLAEAPRQRELLVGGEALIAEHQDVVLEERVHDRVFQRGSQGLREIDIKQMGVGLALAILIDATVIRAVLLPATMKLLGEWNWFLPRWLHRLPEGVLGGDEAEHQGLGEPAGVAAVRDPSRVDARNPEPIRGTSAVVDLHAAVGVRDGRVDPHT